MKDLGKVVSGQLMKVLGLNKFKGFMEMDKVWDSEVKALVEGEKVKEVVAKEVAKKHKVATSACEQAIGKVECGQYGAEEGRMDCPLRREVKAGSTAWWKKGRVTLQQVLKERKVNSKVMPGFDMWVPRTMKYMNRDGWEWMRRVYEDGELGLWGAVMSVLHLTLQKSVGYDVNENTRPIKI